MINTITKKGLLTGSHDQNLKTITFAALAYFDAAAICKHEA